MSPLACSVRGCGAPLERRGHAFVCARGHAYDVARSGYVNLLQPHHRRSASPGDSREQVAARGRLLDAGIGRTILDAFVRRAAALELPDGAHVVDLGSGSGDTLSALAAARSIDGIGIDLSTAAASRAARRFPGLTWVVANADRRLPLADRTVALALSFHGRRHPAECARVLAPDGFLLIGVPAGDDLIELRASIQGGRIERERADSIVAAHEPFFTLVERSTIRERQGLPRGCLLDLLRGTYRGGRPSAERRLRELGSLEVTLASDFLLFAGRQK